jgi:dethiobiotin synthetase
VSGDHEVMGSGGASSAVGSGGDTATGPANGRGEHAATGATLGIAPILGVVGTDTGAGKTVVAAAITAALRARGRGVAAVKPVATGVEPGEAGEDATLLARASGCEPGEALLESFRLPRSPLAAARAEQRSLDVEALVRALRARAAEPGLDVLVVEGVGGLLVPLTEHHTVRDLMRRLGAPVLVVGRAGLGTIGHCALTVESARGAGLDVCGVVLSDVDGSVDEAFAKENAAQIEAQCHVRVLGILPYLADTCDDPQALARAAEESLDLDALLQKLHRSDTLHDEVVALDRRPASGATRSPLSSAARTAAAWSTRAAASTSTASPRCGPTCTATPIRAWTRRCASRRAGSPTAHSSGSPTSRGRVSPPSCAPSRHEG